MSALEYYDKSLSHFHSLLSFKLILLIISDFVKFQFDFLGFLINTD